MVIVISKADRCEHLVDWFYKFRNVMWETTDTRHRVSVMIDGVHDGGAVLLYHDCTKESVVSDYETMSKAFNEFYDKNHKAPFKVGDKLQSKDGIYLGETTYVYVDSMGRWMCCFKINNQDCHYKAVDLREYKVI